jgi:hypothetical protein
MLAINALLFAAALAAFPHVTLGCSCIAVDFNTSLHEFGDMYFRGRVIKDITAQPPKPVKRGNATDVDIIMPFDFADKKYVVQVGRVFKGCAIKPTDRLLVTSGAHSCGISLTVNGDYVFSSGIPQPLDADTRAVLGNRTKITQSVEVGSCGFNQIWTTVPEEQKAMLRSYKKKCP